MCYLPGSSRSVQLSRHQPARKAAAVHCGAKQYSPPQKLTHLLDLNGAQVLHNRVAAAVWVGTALEGALLCRLRPQDVLAARPALAPARGLQEPKSKVRTAQGGAPNLLAAQPALAPSSIQQSRLAWVSSWASALMRQGQACRGRTSCPTLLQSATAHLTSISARLPAAR